MFAVVAVGLFALRDRLAGRPGAALAAEAATVPAKSASPDPAPAPAGGRTAELRKEGDGHYYATAYVNGFPLHFMVDTGASVIALTKRDAQRIGLNTDALPRNANVSTASGHVQAQTAMLETVKIERVEVSHVQAVVIDDGLEQSLLGMSFMNALHDWNVTPEAIVIRQ